MIFETVTCPGCEGNGSTFVFAQRVDAGCSAEDWRCNECGGVGFLTHDEFRAYRVRKRNGQFLRHARRARGLQLHEAAAEQGISIVELSALERGEKPRG